MTSFDRFERSLPALLDELAAPRTPDYFDDLLARTAATRQRPGWTFPERWLPVSTLSTRLAAAPRIPWRLAGAVALLLLAALIGLLVAGGRPVRVPAPFGPAANGGIAFVDANGAISIGDPSSGTTRVVVPGPGIDRATFSADGTQLAFLQARPEGGFDVKVGRADGTGIRTLNTKTIFGPKFLQWAPDGRAIAVTLPTDTLELFDTSRTGEPIVVANDIVLGANEPNDHVANLFRPPSGDELLVVNNAGTPTLQVLGRDGALIRTLIEPTPGFPYTSLWGAQWSPDGAQIVVLINVEAPPDVRGHLFILNADGSNLRPLYEGADDHLLDAGAPAWSPDGTKIAFMHWERHAADGNLDFLPITVVDVATGALHEVGARSTNGWTSLAWSPDGVSILEVPADDSGTMIVVDATTGAMKTVPWAVRSVASWQRLHR